jgi:hypothetical protein
MKVGSKFKLQLGLLFKDVQTQQNLTEEALKVCRNILQIDPSTCVLKTPVDFTDLRTQK